MVLHLGVGDIMVNYTGENTGKVTAFGFQISSLYPEVNLVYICEAATIISKDHYLTNES